MCNFKSDRRNLFSYWLFALYGTFMLISCLVEANIIKQSSICRWGGNGPKGVHYHLCMTTSGGA